MRSVSADGKQITVVKDRNQDFQNTVAEADEELYIDGLAGQIFRFNILAFIISNSADFLTMIASFSYPSGATIRWNTSVDAASGSAALTEADTDNNNSPLANASGACCQWDGVIKFGTTPGRVALNLAQSVEGGKLTMLKDYSTLVAQKLVG